MKDINLDITINIFIDSYLNKKRTAGWQRANQRGGGQKVTEQNKNNLTITFNFFLIDTTCCRHNQVTSSGV